MELRQMIYFKELSEQLNLPSAARTLYITPQALSKSMRNLARELNTEIFFREQGKLQLTTFGKVLYQEVSVLLTEMTKMEERLKNVASQENGKLRISCSHGILQGSFQRHFDLFKKQHPEIELEFIELPDFFAEQYIEQEECDLGLSINWPQHPELLESSLLESYQLCAVVPLDHPLAQHSTLTLKECSLYPLITKNRIFKIFETVDECAKKQNLHLTYALQSPNEVAWKQMVQDHQGVGIGTMYYHHPKIEEELAVIPFEETELTWNIVLIRRKDHYLSSSARSLTEFLIQQCIR